jgi:hypothetical protein
MLHVLVAIFQFCCSPVFHASHSPIFQLGCCPNQSLPFRGVPLLYTALVDGPWVLSFLVLPTPGRTPLIVSMAMVKSLQKGGILAIPLSRLDCVYPVALFLLQMSPSAPLVDIVLGLILGCWACELPAVMQVGARTLALALALVALRAVKNEFLFASSGIPLARTNKY